MTQRKASGRRGRTPHLPGMPRLAPGSSRKQIEALRQRWIADHISELSLVPILNGSRGPRTADEDCFCWFLGSVALVDTVPANGTWTEHYRAVCERTLAIERQLNARGIGLLDLLPWYMMATQVERLDFWKETKLPRGRRPRVDLRKDLNRIVALITSGNVSDQIRVLLVGEHARLEAVQERLAADGLPDARRQTFPHWDQDGAVAINVKDPLYPPRWRSYVATAHRVLVERGRFDAGAADRQLYEILTLLLPRWFPPGVMRKQILDRIRSLRKAYLPSRLK